MMKQPSFSKKIKNPKRETGFYWVRIKRTQAWMVAHWMSSYQWFEESSHLMFDIRSGFDMVCEERIQAPNYVERRGAKRKSTPVKPVRRNKPVKRVRRRK